MWSKDISVQFAHPELRFPRPSLFLLASVCSSPFQFQPVSQLLTYSPPLPLLPSRNSLSQISIIGFFSLSPASAYKPETLPPALPRCWKWRESGKGVITMSIHKHRTPRDCTDESANATGKLPTQPGQVICYTVEQNDKHSDSGVHTKRKVQTVGR